MSSYDIKGCPEYEYDESGTIDERGKPSPVYDIDKFRRCYLSGMTDLEIQRKMGGMPKTQIAKYKRRIDQEIGFRRQLDDAEEAVRMELYNQGLKDCEIEKKLNLSKGAIGKWRKRRSLERNE